MTHSAPIGDPDNDKPDIDTPIILGLMAGIASIVVITSIAVILLSSPTQ
jgi:hypothetical protein